MNVNASVLKFAPVAPIQVLRGMLSHGVTTFGTYHLLLAHHTVEKADEFGDLFRDVYANGNAHEITIIMDNSIVELGESQCFDMMRQACSIVNLNAPTINLIAVLPDVMGSGGPTQAAVTQALPEWSELMEDGISLMAVIQGNCIGDFLETADYMMCHYEDGVKYWGIPRILYKTVGSRAEALERLDQHMQARDYGSVGIPQMHLLGFCDNMQDDLLSARYVGLPIMGIDSAVPLRVEDDFNIGMIPESRPPNWFEEASFDHQMVRNLQLARTAFETQEA